MESAKIEAAMSGVYEHTGFVHVVEMTSPYPHAEFLASRLWSLLKTLVREVKIEGVLPFHSKAHDGCRIHSSIHDLGASRIYPAADELGFVEWQRL